MESSKRGAMEAAALLLIGVSWLAYLLVPVGTYLWLGLGIIGLVLVWASRVWSIQRKVITTVIVVAVTGALLVASVPAY